MHEGLTGEQVFLWNRGLPLHWPPPSCPLTGLTSRQCSNAEVSISINIIHDFYENNSLDWLMLTAYIPNQAVG